MASLRILRRNRMFSQLMQGEVNGLKTWLSFHKEDGDIDIDKALKVFHKEVINVIFLLFKN